MSDTPKTGWPPVLLQDDSKQLSKWLASRPDARRIVRMVAAEIVKARTDRVVSIARESLQCCGNRTRDW